LQRRAARQKTSREGPCSTQRRKNPLPNPFLGLPTTMNSEPVALALDSCANALRTLALALRTERPPLAAAPGPDRLLTADEAAGVLGVNRKWLYRRASQLSFVRRLSYRTLRFSEAGLRRWME